MQEESIDIYIDRLNLKGKGVGSYRPSESSAERKVEVIGALPGDTLRVRLGKSRRGKYRADLEQVISPAPDRVGLRCVHAPSCGGCSWQQWDYSSQLQEKQRRIAEIFSPLLQDNPQILQTIIPCPHPWQYRNKMEFSFSQNKAGERFLGLVIGGSRGHVFHLTECHLVSPWFSQVVACVRNWWNASSIAAYRMNDTGSLRTLTVREGKNTGDKLVMLTVSGNPDYALVKADLMSFVAAVKASVPEEEQGVLSIFLRIQQQCKGAVTQFFEMQLFGKDHLKEQLTLPLDPPLPLTFKVSPTSFFQPNTAQAEILYAAALRSVVFPKKHVLDLYAGTSTLGIALSFFAEKVTSIEINPHACFDAEVNKELNGADNLEILCGDVGDQLAQLSQRPDFVPPDLVVVDPPRTGLDSAALAHLLAIRAPEILYISCNPATQCPNIQELVAQGYVLTHLQPVDQFPHTLHVEMIALLRLV